MRDRENIFYKMGKKSTNTGSYKVMCRFLVIGMLPKVASYFKIRLFDVEQFKFYHELVHSMIAQREKMGIIRPDMIHLLMEARKGELKREAETGSSSDEGFATTEDVTTEDLGGSPKLFLDDDDMTAQCFLFLLAGFDTSSTLLCFAASELMENPDAQYKLIEELDSVKEQLNGKPLTYDVMQKMEYLDMVISGKNTSLEQEFLHN